jgi:hypothetical protein
MTPAQITINVAIKLGRIEARLFISFSFLKTKVEANHSVRLILIYQYILSLAILAGRGGNLRKGLEAAPESEDFPVGREQAHEFVEGLTAGLSEEAVG